MTVWDGDAMYGEMHGPSLYGGAFFRRKDGRTAGFW